MKLNKSYLQMHAAFSPSPFDWKSLYNQKIMMIGGEGLVFFLIMVWGIFQIQRSFKRELELAKQQKNFLLSVTHELKTPLASVRLVLETLQKHNLKEETKLKVTEQGITEADRLNMLIEKILFSTRLEDQGLYLNIQEVNLADLIHATLDTAIQTIGKEHKTILEIDEKLRVKVDEWAFKSILINLYENALKYSPSGSTVKVSLFKEEHHACLMVEDEGFGISVENRANIFKKFFRIENEDTRSVKGTGLGLYIVKSLVDLHDAKIELVDKEPTGTRFQIYFKHEKR
jgi:K+-sensing histidine kinase KdpD